MTDHDQTYPPIAPYLSIQGAAEAIAWYGRVFGAEETEHYDYEGRVGHSTLRLANGGQLMLSDEYPENFERVGTRSPQALGGTTVTVNLSVDDVDAWFERATAGGATGLYGPSDEFYGRHAKLRDPFGHVWSLLGPKKD